MSGKIIKTDRIPKKLYNYGERKFFKKNSIIIQSGDFIDYIYILVKGSILILSNTKSGSTIYHFLLVPPCPFGLIHAINKKEVIPTIKCLDNVEVIKISRNTVLSLMESDIDISTCLQNQMFSSIQAMNNQAINYASLTSEERITKALIEFADVLGEQVDDNIKINYKISLQFIGNFTGVKRTTTYRIFEKLREKDIIEFIDSYYYIKNLDLLKKIAFDDKR